MANDPHWEPADVPTFSLVSPDFRDGDTLPQWTRSGITGAGGEDRSPTLHWDGAPSGTKSFALTMFDPDAPTGSGWWHWAVYNIPAPISSLPADAGNPDAGLLPAGAVTVHNELRLQRYQGASPPSGHGEHRYFFTVHALDVELMTLPDGCTPAMMTFVMGEHVVARAQLMAVSATD